MDQVKFPAALDLISKAVIGVASTCYVIGLLVINFHLSNYGHYSLNLFRLSYVTAGLWALSPFVIALFATLGVAYVLSQQLGWNREQGSVERARVSKARLVWKFAWALAVALFLCFSLVNSLSVWLLDLQLGWKWIPFILVAGLLASGTPGIAYMWRKQETRATFSAVANAGFLTSMVVVAWVGYVAFFGRTLYQEIPSSLGGGGPRQVQLVLAREDAGYLRDAGIPFPSDRSNITSPLLLVVSEGDLYIVRLPNSTRTLSIPGRIIKAIVFLQDLKSEAGVLR